MRGVPRFTHWSLFPPSSPPSSLCFKCICDFPFFLRPHSSSHTDSSWPQVFYVPHGGFDTHSSLKDTVDSKFQQMNAALAAFETEMKALGVWDDMILITSSDFGRTYASNGAGTVRDKATAIVYATIAP